MLNKQLNKKVLFYRPLQFWKVAFGIDKTLNSCNLCMLSFGHFWFSNSLKVIWTTVIWLKVIGLKVVWTKNIRPKLIKAKGIRSKVIRQKSNSVKNYSANGPDTVVNAPVVHLHRPNLEVGRFKIIFIGW